MQVLVLYTLPPHRVGAGRSASEFDLHAAASEVVRVLPGAEAVGVEGFPTEILRILESRRPDAVFNLCEAPQGCPELESTFAGLLEWLGVPFTGSGSETLALCRRKDLTKSVLATAGIG